jgi:hypothetical protein
MFRDHSYKENAMAKKDGVDEKEPETQEQAPMAKKAEEPVASTEGLVKMHKDGTSLHVHPTAVKAHVSAGWKHA